MATNPAALPPSATCIFVPGTQGSGPLTDFFDLPGVNTWAFENGLGGLFNAPQYQPHLRVNYSGDLAPFFGTKTLQASIDEGVPELDRIIKTTPGPKIIVGASQGTMVIDQELRNLSADPKAPPASECLFINCASPERPGGLASISLWKGEPVPIVNYQPKPVPDSQYNVVVLTQQYDGIADYPQRNPLEVLALWDAVTGIGYLHGFLYAFGVLPQGYKYYPNITTTKPLNVTRNPRGGVTTTYFLPTDDLPMFDNLFPILGGVGLKFTSMLMRPVIEASYNRAALDFKPGP